MKYTDWRTFSAGLAAGGWAGGSFLGPDLSMIFAYENPYCVPFIDAGGYTSHPLRATDVVITDLTPGSASDRGARILSPLGQGP